MSQPSAEVRVAAQVARSLTNAALAQRLGMIRDTPRSVPKLERNAYLDEAARRLRWPNEYDKLRTEGGI